MESDVFGDASKRPAVESPPAVRTEDNHLRLPPLRFFQNFPPIAVARDRRLRRCFEAGLIVGSLPVPLQPPEQVGGADDVAEDGEALGDGTDVGTHAEDLLEEHEPGSASRCGSGE